MTSDENSPETSSAKTPPIEDRRHHRGRHRLGRHAGRRLGLGLGGAALLGLGVVAGGVGTALVADGGDRSLLLQPTAISALKDSRSTVAISGKVSDVFGNKLIVEDQSGRALIETGRRGEGETLARSGETITAQGRFEDGFMRATLLVGEGGRVVDLKPSRPPFGPLKDQIARIAGR